MNRSACSSLTALLCTLLLGACSRPEEANFVGPMKAFQVVNLPIQSEPVGGPISVSVADVHLEPQASYEIAAKVMSTKNYESDDLGDLAKVDAALVWGELAEDDAYLAELSISQSNRFYFWRTDKPLAKYDKEQLNASMANVHLIGSNAAAEAFVKGMKAGECVWMKGLLVNVESDNPRLQRKTSMTRTDSGPGACEILYITEAKKIAC